MGIENSEWPLWHIHVGSSYSYTPKFAVYCEHTCTSMSVLKYSILAVDPPFNPHPRSHPPTYCYHYHLYYIQVLANLILSSTTSPCFLARQVILAILLLGLPGLPHPNNHVFQDPARCTSFFKAQDLHRWKGW